MLEPDPEFNGGSIYTYGGNCNRDLTKFNYSTKTWNCPWDVNSKSNWLTTDGTKIVVDTSKALASTTKYKVETKYYLWCACSGSTYTDTYYEKTASFFF